MSDVVKEMLLGTTVIGGPITVPVSDESTLAAILRVEAKLDALIKALQSSGVGFWRD